MAQLWAGVDAGKAHHHCVVIDADGTRLYSQRVSNDESALLNLIAYVAVFFSSSPGRARWCGRRIRTMRERHC